MSNKKTQSQTPTIAVISWCLSHNALGRAYMLAEALSSRCQVKLIGFIFDNKPIWEPVKNSSIPITSYQGSSFPEFANILEKAALDIDADIILVCKPRIPSLQLGLLIKAFHNKPLILDIDDEEIGFINKQSGYTPNDLKIPSGETWTRFSNG